MRSIDWKNYGTLSCLAALCLAACIGCEAGVPTHPVSGKVLQADGTPAQSGLIEFRTTAEDGSVINARGQIESDGTFRLSTFGQDDGALAGDHQAILVSPATSENSETGVVHSFPAKYRSYATSDLQFRVEPGQNEFAVQVKAK
ncbi:hypothetical protein M4951_05470 [Blastopirellula sp. J2-11]|uniref:hypothetical protein n=1 Tax=Blastopirellula sp. J2-11 TaxID=2943192 RepID=UPI0021CA14A2|nr:hypothetical protein [Blastopirellula sp. J2-11]UUO07759.1 hypothetical protein M4951_05470 [Blastopirellula sp. J2-11]